MCSMQEAGLSGKIRARVVQHLPHGRKGRPAAKLAAVVVDSWHPSNGSLEAQRVTNTDKRQWVWYCSCKQHTHTCTTACLTSKYPQGLPCHICSQTADSWHELVVRGVLAQHDVPFQVYPKILGKHHGSVDIFLPTQNLIIAVDGPSHMEEACRSVSLQAQREIDCNTDEAVLHQGRRMLRLHYKDIETGYAWSNMCQALALCHQHPSPTPFVLFSYCYRQLGYKSRMPHAP